MEFRAERMIRDEEMDLRDIVPLYAYGYHVR